MTTTNKQADVEDQTVPVTLTLQVKVEELADWLDSASVHYIAERIEVKSDDKSLTIFEVPLKGGSVMFHLDGDFENRKVSLTKAKMLRGLKAMAADDPELTHTFITNAGECDGYDSLTFLQYCLFGEVVVG